jgi:phage shock protein A
MEKLQTRISEIKKQRESIARKQEKLAELEKNLARRQWNLEVELQRKQMNKAFNPMESVDIDVTE